MIVQVPCYQADTRMRGRELSSFITFQPSAPPEPEPKPEWEQEQEQEQQHNNNSKKRRRTHTNTHWLQPKQTLQQHAISTEAPGAPWYNKPSCWQWTFVSTEAMYGWRSMIGKDLRCQGNDPPRGFLPPAVSSELRSQFVTQLASCGL